MMLRSNTKSPPSSSKKVCYQSQHHDHLPPELLMEILGRLPSKTLLRLRCVCKSWRSLIEDPDFALLHLTLSSSNSNELLLIIELKSLSSETESWNGRRYGYEVVRTTRYGFKKTTSDLTKPWPKMHRIFIGGYVNGLVLLYTYRFVYSTSNHIKSDARIKLWNPSTRKSLALPSLPKQPDCGILDLALGYNPTSSFKEDYKVLAFRWRLPEASSFKDLDPAYARFLVKYNNTDHPLGDDSMVCRHFPSIVHLYSLSTGRWRTIWRTSICGNATAQDGDEDYGHLWWWHLISDHKFVKGVIYWIGFDRRFFYTGLGCETSRIISFDVGREVFEWNTMLPDHGADTQRHCFLGVMGESTLAFLAYFRMHISIWLMDQSSASAVTDGHDRYSWIKFGTINVQSLDDSIAPTPNIYMTKGGELLVIHTGKVTCYDIKQGEIKNVYQQDQGNIHIIFEYVESLALLKKGKPDGEENDLASYVFRGDDGHMLLIL